MLHLLGFNQVNYLLFLIFKAVVGSAGVGVMASLYGSKVTEGGMTLELSLEINKKLQVRFLSSIHLFICTKFVLQTFRQC